MLIAIEGIDGAGKQTQAHLLRDRIVRNNLTANVISFPRYNATVFSRSIAQYLNGEYGPLHTIDPHFAALLYAGDRWESRDHLLSIMRSFDVVIADRYVASNFAYQGARVRSDVRWSFIQWIAEIEHEAYGMPRADLSVYLDIPVPIASRLVAHKDIREYTALSADIHEQDVSYLDNCRKMYLSLAQSQYGGDWKTVNCTSPSGELLAADTIHELLWQSIAGCISSMNRVPMAH